MSAPPSPLLSPSQLAALAEIGEERSAPVGELLYRVGDRTYPFIAILEGEVAIIDAAGNELDPARPLGLPRRAEPPVGADGLRQRARDRAAALHRGRARRAALAPQRGRPAQRPAPLHVHLPARGVAERAGDRPRDRRPARFGADDADARVRAREPAPVHLAGDSPARRRRVAARAAARRRRAARPNRRPGAARSRDRARARASRGGRPADRRRRPGGPRRRGLRRLRRARHAGRREHRARRPGRVVPPDRELPRLPRRDQRHRAHEPRSHPGAQVQRAHRDARTAPSPSSRGTAGISSGSRTTGRSPRAPSCSRRAPSTGGSRSTALPSSRD